MNIGIVLGTTFRKRHNIRALLDAFLARYFPEGTVVSRCAGTIPCYVKRQPVATSGLIKAGDAISTVNPISRAGISESMKSGTLAGEFALRMLGAESQKQASALCAAYEKAWYKKLGSTHLKLARVKKSLLKVPDPDYDRSAHALAGIPQDQLTMSKIFTLSLGKFPRLVWALRHLM
jgi:flavin-dependent dehydrogenase